MLGFGVATDGWQPAQFLDVPGFGPSGTSGYAFALPGSRVTAFAIPVEQLPPDTLVLLSTYFQDSTGRNFLPAEEAAAVAKWADARAKSASSC